MHAYQRVNARQDIYLHVRSYQSTACTCGYILLPSCTLQCHLHVYYGAITCMSTTVPSLIRILPLAAFPGGMYPLHICMYVSMYVCMYVCMYVKTCTYSLICCVVHSVTDGNWAFLGGMHALHVCVTTHVLSQSVCACVRECTHHIIYFMLRIQSIHVWVIIFVFVFCTYEHLMNSNSVWLCVRACIHCKYTCLYTHIYTNQRYICWTFRFLDRRGVYAYIW